MIIDFNGEPVNVYYNYRKFNMFVCNASFCDTSGVLKVYTNGCDIVGANDELISGGDNINPGAAHQISCVDNEDGYASGIQSAMFLQLPEIDSVYYLFHKQMKIVFNPTDAFTEKLLYSVVDMRENNGYGKVVYKNIEMLNDTLAYGKLVSVKHANGKDWWIITPRRKNNVFYVFKFTKDGVVDTLMQIIGIIPDYTTEGYGQIVFSPDGTKIYRTNPHNPIMVYSFDRESGFLSNFDTISYVYGNTPVGEIGCAVSPNGRFLYLGARRKLFQLDLQALNISASQTLVAEWDGYANPIATLFWQLQLGPDCKIYGQAGDTRFYHVIHNPDEPGLACNAEQRGLPLPTPSGASMPSFPNYRLGPIDNPGVPCTATVSAGNPPPTPLPPVSVFPNPAVSYLKVIVNRPMPVGAQWTLYDAYGRVLRAERLVNEVTCTEVAVEGLATGVYFWELKAKDGAVVQSGKVFKQ